MSVIAFAFAIEFFYYVQFIWNSVKCNSDSIDVFSSRSRTWQQQYFTYTSTHSILWMLISFAIFINANSLPFGFVFALARWLRVRFFWFIRIYLIFEICIFFLNSEFFCFYSWCLWLLANAIRICMKAFLSAERTIYYLKCKLFTD